MKLVSGSNKSLGTYRFDEISTVAPGQVLSIEKLISLQNSRVKTETSGQRCSSGPCNLPQNMPKLNSYYALVMKG